MKKGKATAKPKLKKAQSGGYNDTSGKNKIGPAIGIGIPVTGMVAAGATMIKNAVKRRKERKAEEEKKKAKEAAKKMTMKKTGGVAKYKTGGIKKYQPGGGTGRLEGPLPEFAARQVSDYSDKFPIPSKQFVAPADDSRMFGKDRANNYRDPKYSFHHQATNEFYNDNKDLYGSDRDAYYKKMDATRPAVMKEIEKRKAVANDRITMTPRPAVPIQKRGGATNAKYKKGGLVKAQDGKSIKSNKVRTLDMNYFGPSRATVSKTRRDGTTVTKSINTNQGYAPTASKTKTVTDAKGNTTSSTKDMGWNKALRKQERISKKVGRNPEDVYKTGGMVNPNAKVSVLKKAGSNGVKSGVNPKATAAKKATGRTGGTSKAPRTAKPRKNK